MESESDSDSSADSEDSIHITAGDIFATSATKDGKLVDPEGSKKILDRLNAKTKSKRKVRKQYRHLAKSCQELQSGDVAGTDKDKKIDENLTKSRMLFDKYAWDFVAMGPRELYIACHHANVLSEMVQHRSDLVGNSSSQFNLQTFISALKNNHRGISGSSVGQFSTDVLQQTISVGHINRTVPDIFATMEFYDLSTVSNSVDATVKKPRAAYKKKIKDQTNPTKHIVVNVRDEQRRNRDKSASKLSMDLLQILQIYYAQNNKALGLYNFTMDKNSLAETVKYIFYLSFLVREGRASIRREEDDSLVVKPEKPPKLGHVCRQQFILSISSRQWKALAEASQGEDIITAYKVAHLRATPITPPKPASIPRTLSLSPDPQQPSTSKQADERKQKYAEKKRRGAE